MVKKFSDQAREGFKIARQEALLLNSEVIGTEHILLGIVLDGQSIAAEVLQGMSIDFLGIRTEIERLVVPNRPSAATAGEIPISPHARRVIELAEEIAQELGQEAVAPEHLLLGILKEGGGVAAQALVNLGVRIQDVRDKMLKEPPKNRAPRPAEHPKIRGWLLLAFAIGGSGALYLLATAVELPPGSYPALLWVLLIGLVGPLFFFLSAFLHERVGIRVFRKRKL